jgi:predicted SAM-dependent methyltransferase
MQQLANKHGRVWLNVASSYLVLDDFVNLDNSPFVTLVPLYSGLKFVLKSGHLETLKLYRDAMSRAVLLKHDCRKSLPFSASSIDHILCSHFLEHVYPEEAAVIIQNFHQILKPQATLHVIVPDLGLLLDQYIQSRGQSLAAHEFVRKSILSHEKQPSLLFRLFEFLGGYGLQHRWMYDKYSLAQLLITAGFTLVEDNDSPSVSFRQNDGQSLHLLAKK